MKRFRLTRPPRLNENDIERACLDLLRIRGYWIIRQQCGLFKTPDGRWIRLGEAGLPDYGAIHAIHPGFLLEVKRPGAKPKPHQETKIHELRCGYRLAIAVVDSAVALASWLDAHELKTRKPPGISDHLRGE